MNGSEFREKLAEAVKDLSAEARGKIERLVTELHRDNQTLRSNLQTNAEAHQKDAARQTALQTELSQAKQRLQQLEAQLRSKDFNVARLSQQIDQAEAKLQAAQRPEIDMSKIDWNLLEIFKKVDAEQIVDLNDNLRNTLVRCGQKNIRFMEWARNLNQPQLTFAAHMGFSELALLQTLTGHMRLKHMDLQGETAMPAKFNPGQVALTPGCKKVLEQAGQVPLEFLKRHVGGDWGDMSENDKQDNEKSLKDGGRLMSVYHTTTKVKLYCITEADRSITTLLLPEEY